MYEKTYIGGRWSSNRSAKLADLSRKPPKAGLGPSKWYLEVLDDDRLL